MEAPSSAGGFFISFLFRAFCSCRIVLGFFICFILCSFGLNQKNQKFKASESSAKMFARKPKTSETRLSAQTTEVFAAPSLHFYASLSGGHFPPLPQRGKISKNIVCWLAQPIDIKLVRPPERKALKKYWKKPVKKLSLFEQAEGKAGRELGKV